MGPYEFTTKTNEYDFADKLLEIIGLLLVRNSKYSVNSRIVCLLHGNPNDSLFVDNNPAELWFPERDLAKRSKFVKRLNRNKPITLAVMPDEMGWSREQAGLAKTVLSINWNVSEGKTKVSVISTIAPTDETYSAGIVCYHEFITELRTLQSEMDIAEEPNKEIAEKTQSEQNITNQTDIDSQHNKSEIEIPKMPVEKPEKWKKSRDWAIWSEWFEYYQAMKRAKAVYDHGDTARHLADGKGWPTTQYVRELYALWESEKNL